MRIMWKNSGDCPCSSILVFLPALVRISHTEKICPNPAVTLKSWHFPPGASMMQYVRFSKVSRCLGTTKTSKFTPKSTDLSAKASGYF